MTFSNVNVFKTSVYNLRSSGPGNTADKITTGGGFSPNTQEAIAIMRSNTDNQWENGYIVKYQAVMQNRLNRLKQDLTNAYKALLEMSSVQRIDDSGDLNPANSALTDVYGQMLGKTTGAATDGYRQAFKGLTYYTGEDLDGDGYNDFEEADMYDSSTGDGIPSYLLDMKLNQYREDGTVITRDGKIEMRKLFVSGPALQVANEMKVAFRTEEVPPKYSEIDVLGIPLPIGEKPFTAAQKVAEYSAEVKSGGFWTTLNYLYNFAPREMKYSYPTAYSATTEEAGSRQKAGKQAMLTNNELLDTRDTSGTVSEDAPAPSYDADNRPPTGERVKWNSSTSTDGYLTERRPDNPADPLYRTPQKDNAGNIINAASDTRLITRRATDTDATFRLNSDVMNSADDIVKANWPFPTTGTQSQTYYGNEDLLGGAGRADDKIKWNYNHDGIGAADLNQDESIDANDRHVAKAAFINHYTVQTQTVELNSTAASRGTIKAIEYSGVDKDISDPNRTSQFTLRSAGIDGSADHVFNDQNKNDVVGDAADEKILLAGSSKISKNFDGKYVSNLYNISTYNGQELATESANININAKNEKDGIVIAEYEGFKRADSMTKGLAEDYFSKFNSNPRTKEEAETLAKKIQYEINATSMADTDWHYSEYAQSTSVINQDKIMFRHIEEISYQTETGGVDSIKLNYKPDMMDTPSGGGNFNNVVVGFRKTFTLEPRDFQDAVYSPPTSAEIYVTTPTYVPKDVFVDVVTTNASAGADLIVNGKVVTGGTVTGVVGNQVTIRYNLKGYLTSGDNVIAGQAEFNGASLDDSFKLVPSTGNTAQVDTWLSGKISTQRADNYDTVLDNLNSSGLSKPLSSWQSKIMVDKITPAFFNNTYPATVPPEPGLPPGFVSFKAFDEYQNALNTLGSVNTSTRVKENNAFARILNDALNKKEYQDIFNMGLLNSILGKTMVIKSQISAPTGGSVTATMDIQYDPINNKFILVQNKFDAYSG